MHVNKSAQIGKGGRNQIGESGSRHRFPPMLLPVTRVESANTQPGLDIDVCCVDELVHGNGVDFDPRFQHSVRRCMLRGAAKFWPAEDTWGSCRAVGEQVPQIARVALRTAVVSQRFSLSIGPTAKSRL